MIRNLTFEVNVKTQILKVEEMRKSAIKCILCHGILFLQQYTNTKNLQVRYQTKAGTFLNILFQTYMQQYPVDCLHSKCETKILNNGFWLVICDV